jgi:capsular polysaccharide biosynthesis protein
VRVSNLINFLNPAAPKGLVRSAPEWVAAFTRRHPQGRQPQPRAWLKEIFPAEDNTHVLPYRYEATAHDEFSSIRWTSNAAARLYYLQQCRILGSEGAVISPDNRVFADFTLPPADRWLDHSCFKRRRIPRVTRLKGWYATIAWPESTFFFHWMIEALPRMALLADHIKGLDGMFVPGPIKRFQAESLQILGIPAAKLIPLDMHSHFQPEHLFVPDAFAMYNPPRWLHTWFRTAYLPRAIELSPAVTHKRLYISRSDAPARRLQNEDEVLGQLSQLGFVSIRLSDYSMTEQAHMFHEASAIVAAHGAGLSNLVFCKPGTVVVEILPPRWMAPCFTALAIAAGCDYRHVVATEAPLSSGAGPNQANIQVSVTDLIEVVGKLMSPLRTAFEHV